MAGQAMRIGEVAESTGLSVDAIRFYEKSGLLERPVRTQAGYRLYQHPQIENLEFIQRAQRLGFSLNEIRELLSIQRDPGKAFCTYENSLRRNSPWCVAKLPNCVGLKPTCPPRCAGAGRPSAALLRFVNLARSCGRSPSKAGTNIENRDPLFRRVSTSPAGGPTGSRDFIPRGCTGRRTGNRSD